MTAAVRANPGEIHACEAPRGGVDPYQGKLTPACKRARILSWHRFLNAAASLDATLPKSPPLVGTFTGTGYAGGYTPGRYDNGTFYESRKFKVYANAKGARVVFDLGDNDLRPEEVTWAIQQVRARRSTLFPQLPEYGVIGASYRNENGSTGCDVYDHGDHKSVHVALFNVDQGVPGPQWGRTCIDDPDVQRVSDVSFSTYKSLMGVNAPSINPSLHPNAQRTGAFQIHYGWLAGHYWPGGTDLYGKLHMGRRQAFWVRF